MKDGFVLCAAVIGACSNGPFMSPAYAQGAAAAAPASEGLQEIVVTAQRRSSSLQDVPFSIAALGESQIKAKRIEAAADLLTAIPGGLLQQQDRNTPILGLRGLTSLTTSAGADIPIALLIDDIVYPGPADFNVAFYDVSRIEVLRGPQGTLFGRNVIGGAVSVTNNRPAFENSLGGSVTAGNYGLLQGQGFINAELVPDQLAGRISFYGSRSDGSVKNRLRPGHRLNNDHIASVRGQLRYRPTDALTIDLWGNFNHITGRANPAKILGDQPTLFPPLSPDPYVVDFVYDTKMNIKTGVAGLRVDWDLDSGTLTSLTGYRWTDAFTRRAAVGTPSRSLDINVLTDNKQFTQELRYASEFSGRLNFVVGGFLFNERAKGGQEFTMIPQPGTLQELLLGLGPVRSDQLIDVRIKSYALFGEANYRITPQLTAVVGARYTWDKKKGVSRLLGDQNIFFAIDPPPVIAPFKDSWGAFTPRASLRFEPTPDLSLYATVSKGYQAGGFTQNVATRAGLQRGFDPEYATNYEVGFKAFAWDRRLMLNASAFREFVSDLQVQVIDFTGDARIENAGKVRIQGLELDSSLLLTQDLRLDFNYAYLDAKYQRYDTGTTSFAGNRLPFAPKHSLVAGATYTVPVGDSLKFTIHGDYTYHSQIELQEANNVPDRFKKMSTWNVFNASVSLASADDKYRISVWAKNITKDARLTGFYNGLDVFYFSLDEILAGKTASEGFFADPRTFGVTLSYNY